MTNQNHRISDQYVGRYNHDHLLYLMKSQGLSARSLSDKSGISKTIIAEALAGECKKIETLWAINNALGGEWPELFNLEPKNGFHRAVVRTGNSRTAR